MSMELRHLRCFLAVVEQGTMTGAAKQLHVTQPVVSRTVAQVERHLGVRLIDRSTHHLSLTPAGEAFARRAATALQSFEQAFDAAQLRSWPLRLGHAWSAFGAQTATLLRRWRVEHPGTPLELLRVDDLATAFEQGTIDVAVLRGDRTPRRLHAEVVGHEPRVAVLPEDSPLAGEASLTMAGLRDQTIAINEVSGTTSLNLWPADVRPVETATVGNTEDWLAIIAAGRAVGVSSTATATLHPYPGVVYVPIADAPRLAVRLAWVEPPPHPAVEDLTSLARDVLAPTTDD